MRRGKAGASGASGASRPAFPCREISRWKKQARSGGIRRLVSAWRAAAWAYWATPQRRNTLGTHMATGHTAEVASGAERIASSARWRKAADRLPDAGYSLPARWLQNARLATAEGGQSPVMPPEVRRRAKQAGWGWCLRHEGGGTRYGSFPFIFCWHCRERFRRMQPPLPTPASPW